MIYSMAQLLTIRNKKWHGDPPNLGFKMPAGTSGQQWMIKRDTSREGMTLSIQWHKFEQSEIKNGMVSPQTEGFKMKKVGLGFRIGTDHRNRYQ
jgi:hypothetical protein